jgi:hypothetical protein
VVVSSASSHRAPLLFRGEWEWSVKGKMAEDLGSICQFRGGVTRSEWTLGSAVQVNRIF